MFSFLLNAQDLPINPQPGECYVRCYDENKELGDWKTVNCNLVKFQILDLEFDETQSQLTLKDKKIIKRKLKKLFDKNLAIQISSHFDSHRDDKVNARISTIRGKVIADYLVNELNVKPQLILIYGLGNSEPLESCKTIPNCEKTYSKNSRITYRIVNAPLSGFEYVGNNVWCKKKDKQETISN